MSIRHQATLGCDHCGRRVDQATATPAIPAGWALLQLALDETRAVAGDQLQGGQVFHLCPTCVPTLTPPQLEGAAPA